MAGSQGTTAVVTVLPSLPVSPPEHAGSPHPLFLAASALAGGIAAWQFLFTVGFFLVPCLAAGFFFLFRRSRAGALGLSGIFALGIILAAGNTFTAVPDPPTRSVLIGTVQDAPRKNPDRSSASFDLKDRQERHRYLVRSSLPVLPEPGSVVRVEGKIFPPHGFLDPGVRDWSESLRSRGVEGICKAKSLALLSGGGGLRGTLYRFRQALAERAEQRFSEPVARFMKTLLLGMQEMTVEERQVFARAGVAHLFAVSGTHLGMLAVVLIFVFRWVLLHVLPPSWYLRLSMKLTAGRIAALCTMPLVIGYAFVSGGRLPTMRALVMILSLLGAALVGRRHGWLNALGLAAILILAVGPEALTGASFQLSFAAVGSIGLFVSRVNEIFQRDEESGFKYRPAAMKSIIVWFGLPLAVLIGTWPILVRHFGGLSLVSPFTNLIITPLVGFIIIPMGFIGLIVGHPIALMAEKVTMWVLCLVRWWGTIPGAVQSIPVPSPLWIVAYYGIILVGMRLRWKFVAAAVLAAWLVLPRVGQPPAGEMRAVFLDVGQGAATLVRLPDHRLMLVDTGGSRSMDMGREVLIPALKALGVDRIDYLVLTHLHPDHAGALEALVEIFPPGEVWWSGIGTEDIQAVPVPSGTTLRRMGRGDVLEGSGYSVTVLSPPTPGFSFAAGHLGPGNSSRDPSKGIFENENDESLVLRITSAAGSLLFTGDIEADRERDLLGLGRPLKADVLQIAHHGSRTSSSAGFLQAVSPRVAVASAGFMNSFGHPDPEVSDRIARTGAALYRTDRDGAVEVSLAPSGIVVKRWADARTSAAGLSLPSQWWNLLRLTFGPSFALAPGIRYERTTAVVSSVEAPGPI